MNNLKSQIEDQFKKAFYDLIKEKTNNDAPDYDWIINLYTEMVQHITVFIKKDSKLYNEIYETLDPVLFGQMIKNNAFNKNDMINLVNNTFSIMLRLNAPARDNTLNETKDMIIKKIQNTTSVGEILAIYLKHVHMCIEFYHNDFRNAVNTIDKIDELKHLINGDKFNS